MSTDPEKLKEEGLRLFQEGSYPEALEHFNLACQGFEAAGKTLEAAEMLNNMGVVYRMDGKLAEASEKLENARRIFSEQGDRSREAQTLGNLAPLYNKQGATDRAIQAYTEAATIFDELKDDDRRGEVLMAKGVLLFDKGQRTGGLAAYEAGLMLLKRPTARQKRLRVMLRLRQRLLGG
jgi:tetratricopeptide (TPR) repeat protein